MRMHQTSRSPSPAIDFGAPPSPSIGTICVTHPPHIPSANVNPLYHVLNVPSNVTDTSSQMAKTPSTPSQQRITTSHEQFLSRSYELVGVLFIDQRKMSTAWYQSALYPTAEHCPELPALAVAAACSMQPDAAQWPLSGDQDKLARQTHSVPNNCQENGR